mmetsp:Transcript_6531/g.15869  ORF Transcript_6531/g.15869 Transcript_6531/m.15869 type:complete len:375 (-) Transcript_6531:180-1304(-)
MESVQSPYKEGTQAMEQEYIAESSAQMGEATNTAIDTAVTEPAVPSSLEDQDLVVFGDLNARFADAFAEQIEAAISKGVDSLPLLDGDCYRGNSSQKASSEEIDNKPPKQRLWDALRYRFVRNVDVLEAYCGHHLFTLRKHPPARRKRIVRVMRDGVGCLSPLNANDETKGTNGEEEPTAYPTRSELPSEEERKDLVEELSRLQAELEAAKQKRNALLASVEASKRAEQAVADVVATVEANIPTLQDGTIRSNVSDKVEKGNTVGLLAEEAKSLVGKLDGIKRDRNKKKESDDEEFDFVQQDDPLFKASNRVGNKRHKPLSLEEAYRKDRRQLGLLTDSTNDNGSKVINLSALRSMAMASSVSSASSTPRTQGN